MKAQNGMKVIGHHGSCIGYILNEPKYYGEVVKVNKNSFRVQLSEIVVKRSGKEVRRFNTNEVVTYTYWKTCTDGREVYTTPSRLHGIIEL